MKREKTIREQDRMWLWASERDRNNEKKNVSICTETTRRLTYVNCYIS